VNGKFTQGQKEVYETVLAGPLCVLLPLTSFSTTGCSEGHETWSIMARYASAIQSGMFALLSIFSLFLQVICEELKKHGFLVGDVDEMLKNHIGALFMPHGLGHLMGLDTHDVGGYPHGIERIMEPGIKR
jgi:Xaa-Pro aminopeptidase